MGRSDGVYGPFNRIEKSRLSRKKAVWGVAAGYSGIFHLENRIYAPRGNHICPLARWSNTATAVGFFSFCGDLVGGRQFFFAVKADLRFSISRQNRLILAADSSNRRASFGINMPMSGEESRALQRRGTMYRCIATGIVVQSGEAKDLGDLKPTLKDLSAFRNPNTKSPSAPQKNP